ncbi:MAG: thermonuclease family protein [Mesorhizobium sp.]
MNRQRYRPARRRSGWRTGKSRARRYAEYGLTFLFLIALLVVFARFGGIEQKQLTGQAVVNDGDSITMNGERLRLRGIDAPEYDQTCMKNAAAYDCGRESRRSLQALVRSGPLACEGWEKDRYDRLLVICKAGGVDINRRQVELGWAVSYGDYEGDERAARQARKGVWQGEFERPRAYRQRRGDLAEAPHVLYQTLVNWLARALGW